MYRMSHERIARRGPGVEWLFSGKGRDVGWLTYALAVVLVAYFVFIRSRM
jgi:hypothetical protein